MIRSLYGRLTIALLGILLLIGSLFVAVSIWSSQRYIQEINQKLHLDVAAHLVEEVILLEDGKVNQEGLDHIFHMMMVINPGIEIYLLDNEGRILAFSALPGRVRMGWVSLAPIERFIDDRPAQLPLSGEDPRNPGHERAFSAARIGPASDPQGYLYVVIGGERYASVVQILAGSHILRLSLMALAVICGLAGLAGLVAFALLTSRLRRLRVAMDRFEASGFSAEPFPESVQNRSGNGDEIDELAATFRRLSAEMSRQLERLRSGDVLRRELVANVSHDLRTPLSSLTASLETLMLKEGSLSREDRDRYLAVAFRQSEALGDLVTRLFELAKLEARQVQPRLEAFSPGELLQDVAQKFELKARECGVRIEMDVAAPVPFVCGDVRLIERVLDNLIDNALRHTGRGGRVSLSVRQGRLGARIRVRDTGEGIAAEELPFVFERYYRARRSEVDASRRSGLGLAIAQHIAELHNTHIAVQSQQGRGTCFEFELRFPSNR